MFLIAEHFETYQNEQITLVLRTSPIKNSLACSNLRLFCLSLAFHLLGAFFPSDFKIHVESKLDRQGAFFPSDFKIHVESKLDRQLVYSCSTPAH